MKDPAFRSLWGRPLVISLLSAVGLVGGLVGDGAWDWMTWIGLGVPCVAGVWFGLRGRATR